MNEILSILIPTLRSRADKYNAINEKLLNQLHQLKKYAGAIYTITDDGEQAIGHKRNELLKMAKGKFIVFVDDDDDISDDYVELIVKAIEENPDIDCIGIQGTITFDGKNERQWYISKDYGRWYEENNVYYRTPNHISPVKRELALQIMFPEINFGEDSDYSHRLLPLLKSEVKIEKNIYLYKYLQNK